LNSARHIAYQLSCQIRKGKFSIARDRRLAMIVCRPAAEKGTRLRLRGRPQQLQAAAAGAPAGRRNVSLNTAPVHQGIYPIGPYGRWSAADACTPACGFRIEAEDLGDPGVGTDTYAITADTADRVSDAAQSRYRTDLMILNADPSGWKEQLHRVLHRRQQWGWQLVAL
jgi:hypothetical protein